MQPAGIGPATATAVKEKGSHNRLQQRRGAWLPPMRLKLCVREANNFVFSISSTHGRNLKKNLGTEVKDKNTVNSLRDQK
jgi:hypothetical protein